MLNMDVHQFNIQGYFLVKKTVSKGDTSGRVYLPKEWIGKEVAVVLKEI